MVLVGTAGTAAYGSYLSSVQHGLLDTLFSSKKDVAAPVDGRYNVLLLGGDAGADRTGLRPDSISVASIDAETGQTTIIGIPRNLYNAPFRKGSPLYGPYPDGYDLRRRLPGELPLHLRRGARVALPRRQERGLERGHRGRARRHRGRHRPDHPVLRADRHAAASST